MKTETTSAAVKTATKQVWIEPTLTNLSLPLGTFAMTVNGMDGSGTSINDT